MQETDHEETGYWLRLHRAPRLSLRKTLEYLHRFGDARAICTASAAELSHAGMEHETIQWLHSGAASELVQRDLRWLEQHNHHLLSCADDAYPRLLREIEARPLLLFVSGDISLLNSPMLAVVGPRHPTAGGVFHANCFADALAQAGFVIVSGMAKGIDTVAHTAALDAGSPTIAVTGTGPDQVYPKRNRNLARRIEEQGAIVSEFPCSTPPHPWNFPRRNRLISGLALGTLVIEASERSGSLITATFAREQNREVFAIPGSIRNPAARGCHRLIQNGAKLVQSAEDITIELTAMIGLSATAPPKPKCRQTAPQDCRSKTKPDTPCQRLLDCMTHEEPVTMEALMKRSELTASEISAMLLLLELDGYISSQHDTYVRLV